MNMIEKLRNLTNNDTIVSQDDEIDLYDYKYKEEII